MSEDKQYWKELLGDGYNDELMSSLLEDKQAGKPGGDEAGDEETGGDEKFYTYDPGSIVDSEMPQEPDEDGGIMDSGDDEEDRGPKDFKMNFDFDKEYRDVPKRPVKHKRAKKSGCMGGIMMAAIIICLSLLLASLGWLAATDVLGLGSDDNVVEVTIPKDFDMKKVEDILYQDGLIKYKFLFGLYANISNAKSKITAGTYELNTDYDYRALIYGMSSSGTRVTKDVTIPEGYTMTQIFSLFNSDGICSENDLWNAATNYDFQYDFLDSSTVGQKYRLEGFLFPDTYTFYAGDSPTRVITKMLDNFNSKFTSTYKSRAKDLGYSTRDIINVAAMIEKEAGSDDERATIASVIYNRLKSSSFPYLEIDATVYYAVSLTGGSFNISVDSPYNTYKHKGLPAGPIANPGLASIKAALYPKTTNYYYYALNKKGTHDFFNGYSAFESFVKSDKYGG